MRIALSATAIQGGRSGVGQYVLALVRALLPAAARHEVTLLVLEDDLPRFAFAKGVMRLEPVAETYRAPVRNILWHQTLLPARLRRLGIEVVHVPTYRRMIGPRPCARVATIHDLAPFHLPRKYGRLRGFYGRRVARALARAQDEIIAVSECTAGDLRRFFGIDPARLTVVPNGVDRERFRPGRAGDARARVRASHGIETPFFLYVSRLEHPAKNHVRLIEAFERFKARRPSDWQLALAGADWHGAEAIHARVHASPVRDAIRLVGFIDDGALPTWYRAAGALVYPSLFEGFGLPPIEAMACGCPVLASRRGALAEVVGDAAGRLEPESPDQMSHALERVAGDAAERERLAAAGLVRAERFDWSRAAEATLRVYARAAGQPVEAASPLPPFSLTPLA